MADHQSTGAPVELDEREHGYSRRKFLGSAALLGATGVGAAIGLAGRTGLVEAAAPAGGLSHEVKPGELDAYYGVWSGGHSAEVRVIGVPSGREIKRIPVFNPDALTGWGLTNESKAILGTKADGTLKYTTGDTHHVHGSYKNGIYDGRYFWTNDKIHGRLARIRGDVFECDKITELPNIQGFHGIFPDKADPVDPKINYTTRVFCGSEFHVPHPNDGTNMDDRSKYYCLFTCVDAETMKVKWQCRVDGNMDLVATSFDGKLAASNQYNTEGGALYVEMMSAERDSCVFFNIARIEAAIAAGKTFRLDGSDVPIVDGRKEVNTDPKTALTCYVPVPKNPHGVNASPDGKYFICAGKLSPTATVVELARVLDWFEGKVKAERDTVVAEPELGLGPLHTAFDGRGNAYTTLFLDSQIVKWNIEAAIKAFAGDKSAKPVVDRVDVAYQPGHLNASMSETKAADGKWLAVGCKFSKDRYLPVGPLHPENEVLIDISGEKMKLVHESPVYSEPHDFIIVKRDLIKTKQVSNMADYPNATKDLASSKIVRDGNKVTVHLASAAPAYSMSEIKVKQGDVVTLILTNLDKVEDLTHGFAIPKYDINFIVNPQETRSVTFVADKPGVYWCYCTHFCHALHLEMRSRLMVEKA
ncbi:MAG: nitrous-oxide reductase [Gammaproteobacteria bacterium]|nr:nitrous-oxide reductase [Gammaproteobacteria bacterium]MBI5617806.1 nitrous-oxide reductase [Gammaproteobacteria bacterium]